MSELEHQSRDQPFNQVESVTLDPNTRKIVTFDLSSTASRFFLQQVGISYSADSTYKVDLNGQTEYPRAAFPPSEINETGNSFDPPERFESKMTIEIENLDSSKTKTYHLRIKGWERPRLTSEGGL